MASGNDSQAMVSSEAGVHAERLLIAADLGQVFSKVVRAPEETTSGTDASDYVEDAARSDFLTVLLSQNSRPAVIEEISAALQAGKHVAGFALHYPPYRRSSDAWTLTPEEQMLRDSGTFVKNVTDIVELQAEVKRALGFLMSKAIHRYKQANPSQNYVIAKEWLSTPQIKRVALVQSTSMLLLGSRVGRSDEVEVMRKLESVVKLARGRKRDRPDFVHLFDEDATQLEAEQNGHLYTANSLRRTLKDYKPDASARVHLSAVPRERPLSHVLLVNDNVGLGTPLGSSGSFVSIVEDRRTADAVWGQIRENPKTHLGAIIDRVEHALTK